MLESSISTVRLASTWNAGSACRRDHCAHSHCDPMLIDHLKRRLAEDEALSLRRHRRVAQTACTPHLRVGATPAAQRPLLAFCSNDYLGLATHPKLIAALADGARRYGVGSGASALVVGHSAAHQALEDELAEWMSPFIPGARALSFTSGYTANLALMTVLGEAGATILSDKLNHASLIDGALLARAAFRRYAHGNLAVLERELARCTTSVRLIVTDAVFSMDGDLADLRALLALAERFDAWVVADDAHGFGVLGAEGRGSLAHQGVCSERFILMGTLGKAAGLAGAFVAAHPVVIEALVQRARSYIYTTSAPPAIAHAALASLGLISGAEGDLRRRQLMNNIASVRAQVDEVCARAVQRGWRLAPSSTAIQPLVVGDNAAAIALATSLERQGMLVPAIRPPTVPAGSARLRIALSAAHTEDDIQCLVAALRYAASEEG